MAVNTYRMKVNLEASRWLSLTVGLGPAIKEREDPPLTTLNPTRYQLPISPDKNNSLVPFGSMQSKSSLEWLSVRAVAITEALQTWGGVKHENWVLPASHCEEEVALCPMYQELDHTPVLYLRSSGNSLLHISRRKDSDHQGGNPASF